jgi:hypothetical protein
MRRQTVLCILIASVVTTATPPLPALAGSARIAWDDCWADGGPTTKMFMCDRNDAPAQVLVGSFRLDQPMTGFYAMEAELQIQTPAAALPDWWQLWNAGACREQAIHADLEFSALPQTQCRNLWAGPTIGGTGLNYIRTNVADLTVLFALWDGVDYVPQNLAADTDYYAFRVTISNERTSGPDACAGCSEAACILISRIEVWGPNGPVPCWPDYDGEYSPSNAGWNCGDVVLDCVVARGCTVATRNQTWGSIKSLYR